jgi:hypothetical protein
MSAPITLKYGTSLSRISSNGHKGSLFTSSDRITISVLKGWTLSM